MGEGCLNLEKCLFSTHAYTHIQLSGCQRFRFHYNIHNLTSDLMTGDMLQHAMTHKKILKCMRMKINVSCDRKQGPD